MAGCRMAMKGRPLAKQGYEQELSSIRAFVAMQNKADSASPSSGEKVSYILVAPPERQVGLHVFALFQSCYRGTYWYMCVGN